MLHSRGPYFLAVDQVVITVSNRGGLDLSGIGANAWFGHPEGLQAELAGRDSGKVKALLFVRAMAKQRAHNVHLRVASARVPPRAIDLLENNGSLGHPQPRAAVFFGNQCR